MPSSHNNGAERCYRCIDGSEMELVSRSRRRSQTASTCPANHHYTRLQRRSRIRRTLQEHLDGLTLILPYPSEGTLQSRVIGTINTRHIFMTILRSFLSSTIVILYPCGLMEGSLAERRSWLGSLFIMWGVGWFSYCVPTQTKWTFSGRRHGLCFTHIHHTLLTYHYTIVPFFIASEAS